MPKSSSQVDVMTLALFQPVDISIGPVIVYCCLFAKYSQANLTDKVLDTIQQNALFCIIYDLKITEKSGFYCARKSRKLSFNLSPDFVWSLQTSGDNSVGKTGLQLTPGITNITFAWVCHVNNVVGKFIRELVHQSQTLGTAIELLTQSRNPKILLNSKVATA